jgi:glutamate-5-semialdehyde dehydrogenase
MPASKLNTLARLVSGTPVPFGGDRMTVITPELAEAFHPGDHLLVLQETGDLLHIPAAQIAMAAAAVDRAQAAFMAMSAVPDQAIGRFFDRFAALLEDPSAWHAIAEANRQDVGRAQASGRT